MSPTRVHPEMSAYFSPFTNFPHFTNLNNGTPHVVTYRVTLRLLGFLCMYLLRVMLDMCKTDGGDGAASPRMSPR